MTSRFLPLVALLCPLLLVSCDSSSDEDCLSVTPNDDYILSGAAFSMNFAPASKTYTVRNTCGSDITLSVEEEVRWLDVEIDAFGGGGAESGPLAAGGSVSVAIEVRYGADNPERLDQLAAGSYTAELRFVDETNDGLAVRSVELTVSAP